MTVAVLAPEQHWVCPNCTATAVTFRLPRPGGGMAEMHQCRGLAGVLAPMVLDGVRCKVEAVERGDYVGREKGLRYDGNGRPIMAVRTERADGNDCAVFPGTATGSRREVLDGR